MFRRPILYKSGRTGTQEDRKGEEGEHARALVRVRSKNQRGGAFRSAIGRTAFGEIAAPYCAHPAIMNASIHRTAPTSEEERSVATGGLRPSSIKSMECCEWSGGDRGGGEGAVGASRAAPPDAAMSSCTLARVRPNFPPASSNMLGGASHTVSKIRVKCNGT